jgi:hypothetical protein
MDRVPEAAVLTREFLEALGLADLDVLVIYSIIGWAFEGQDCADCASHQAKLLEMLEITLSECDDGQNLLGLLEGLASGISLN